jgi:hypothetical protein
MGANGMNPRNGLLALQASVLAACTVLLACSPTILSDASDDGGTAVSYASCVVRGMSASCASCANDSCGADISAYEGACSDYLSCICSDGGDDAAAAQVVACDEDVTSSCQSAYHNVQACVQTTCAASCSTVEDAGTVQEGGTMACGVGLASPACASCVTTLCCSATQLCADDPSCSAIIACVQNCRGDMDCQSNCLNDYPYGQTDFNDMSVCWQSECGQQGC